MSGLSLNEHFLGKPGSRWELSTPALVLDLDLFERNLAAMAAHCEKADLGLRPHCKTHKSARIAELQLKHGAVGLCCAKLAEAETLASKGLSTILLTSPVVSAGGLARLAALNAVSDDLIVVVDSEEGAERLDQSADEAGQIQSVLIDLDVGLHRTGIAPGTPFNGLVQKLAQSQNLKFRGVQGYAGHLMHLDSFGDRRAKSLDAMRLLGEARDLAVAAGMPCEIVTGGGTGTYNIDPDAGVLTDLQGGSYVFMDREYNDVPIANNAPMPFETALSVHTTVISNNTKSIVTTDAGLKAFTADAGPPVLQDRAPEGASYFFFGDEQGGISFADKSQTLPLGHVVSCVTPHCDPTVNLYDCYHCVRGDVLVDIWPVDARGKSQ